MIRGKKGLLLRFWSNLNPFAASMHINFNQS